MDKKNIESIFPLTTTQKGLLFHALKEKEEGAYIGQHTLCLKNNIDVELFEKSLHLLAQRYEIFRSRVIYSKLENPVQVILKESPVEFQYLKDTEAEGFLEKDRMRGFSFEKENLIRVALIQTGENTYQNVWTFHHILIDGYCIALLAKDFFEMYKNLQKGIMPEMKPVPSYKTYVNWLKEQDMEKSRKYWMDYTAGVENAVSLPGDLNGTKGEAKELSLTLSKDVSEKLTAYAAEHQVTVNAVMQALWGTVLAAYTDTEELVFGNVMAARPLDLPEADQIVGLFSGTYPSRFSRAKNQNFEAAVRQMNADFLPAIQNSCCSLGEIPAVSKLIRTIYIFENFDLTALYKGAEQAGLEVTDIKMQNHSNYELSISVMKRREELELTFRYDGAKYTDYAIRTIRDDMERIAQEICNGSLHNLADTKKLVSYHPVLGEKKQNGQSKHTDKKIKQTEYAAPATKYEKKLAELFSYVLGIENPGIYSDFFETGGDSILGMRFVAACEKAGLAISLKELFRYSNIAGLAALLEEKASGDAEKTEEPVSHYEPDVKNQYEPFPLNGIQSAYLMGVNEEFELGGFITQYYTEVEGDYDISRLEFAMQKVIAHQAALRTRIENVTSQRILEDMPAFHIEQKDISGLSKGEQEKALNDWREKMITSVFRPEDFPYFKIQAFRLDRQLYRLCFLVECICVDGAGLMMMIKELCHYYEHPEVALQEIKFTFRDYQMALLEEQKKEAYQRDLAFWLEKANTLPLGPEIPLAGNPEKLKNPHFLRKQHLFDEKQYRSLKQLCKANKITMAALLCTAYMEVLSLWSNNQEFSVNMTVFERNGYHEDVQRLIGDFTKLIVVDTQMEKDDLLSQAAVTTETIAEALEHSHYNCVNLMKEIAFRRQLGTKAVMPYVFTCALMDGSTSLMQPVYSLSRTPQVYIDCQVTEQNGGLFLNWDYPEGLFADEMLTEMFEQYVQLIAQAEQNPHICVSHETEEFVKAYNHTFAPAGEREKIAAFSLPDLFVPSFERYANNIAVKDFEKEWTYKKLGEYTYKTAAKLKKAHVQPGDCVGVVGERKAETVAAILAILMCGAAYVPLNEEYPQERVQYIMEKINARVKMDAAYVKAAAKEELAEMFAHNAKADSLAYIIFTSGTTGKPKGVAIRHNSAVNTICDINERCEITEKDRFICLAEFGFDLSVYDIFGSLSCGAKLCIVQNQRNPEEILELLEQEKITFWNSVPAVMSMMTGIVDETYKNRNLRHVYLSGDWIPLHLPDKIRRHFLQAEVTGLGGATEASIWSIYYPTERKAPLASVPYGMPLKNQTIYILNRNLQLCPLGVRGEICIGGDGVAVGYFGEKEKTDASFVNHLKYGRIYRTGDYGRLHREGYVEFLGRIDGQVKIRGFRVELGEIESCALEYGSVKQAVAVNKSNGKGDILALYIEALENVDSESLKESLKKKLPEYMIPSVIVQLDKIPVTQNGKIDRNQLKNADLEMVKTVRYKPETELEYLVGQIFRKTLEIEQVDYEQSFFEMGVDSLKAVVIINELKKKGYQMSLTDIYEHITIASLSKVLETKEVEEEATDDFEDGEI